jgi:flagellar basal body rod protein FlgB
MPIDIIGRTTMAGALKDGLDAASLRVRAIADRVANASTPAPAFAAPKDGTATTPAAAPVDVEAEMARLADEQARYEVTARLLSKAYAGLRASMRE